VLFEFDPAGGMLVPAAGAGGLTTVTGAGAVTAGGWAAAGAPAAARAGGLGM
jgi:hypothetical protein